MINLKENFIIKENDRKLELSIKEAEERSEEYKQYNTESEFTIGDMIKIKRYYSLYKSDINKNTIDLNICNIIFRYI